MLAEWTRRLGQLTFVISVLSLIGLVVSICALQEARRAFGPLRDSADAAKDAAKIASKALEISEGAQLSVDTWGISGWGDIGGPLVQFKLLNSGRTTADVLEVIYKNYIGTTLPVTPDYLNAFITSQVNVPSNSRVEIIPKRKVPVAINQIADIENGIQFIFIYGKITYKSVAFDTIFELGYSQKLTFLRDAQGQMVIRFDFPDTPGYSFLRPIANNADKAKR